jgi:hypothetical protein
MKTIKVLTATAFAAAMMTASTFGTEAPNAPLAKCCAAAKKAGKECPHPCCVEAKKDDKACAKCPASEGEKKPS